MKRTPTLPADFDTGRLNDVEAANAFDDFMSAETRIAAPPQELTRDQIMARLTLIEEKLNALGRTLRRQEVEIQTTRMSVESIAPLISVLRKEIAVDIATRKLEGEGHAID
jgi:archaellum component FlaC